MRNFFVGNRLIAGFVVLNIVSGTAAGILQMIIPIYALSLNANTVQIGLIRGISGLGMLLLVLPAGFLVDHYGSKKLYTIGGVLSSAVVFSLPLATVPLLLILAMGLQGITNSLKFTSLNAAFFKYLNTMGLQKAGWYKGSMSIGLTFLGPFLGGYIIDFISFKVTFILVGFMTIIPALFIFLLGGRKGKAEKVKLSGIFKDQLSDFKTILCNSIIKQTIFTESLSTACFSSFSAFIAVLLVKNYGLPLNYASWLMIIEGGAFILTVFLAGPLLTKYKKTALYLFSFLLACIGLAGISISDNIVLWGITTWIMGVGLGMTNLITYSQVGELEGKKGKISGLFSACTGVGATAGPVIGGVIGQYFGIKAVFLCFIPAFAVLASYIFLRQNRIKGGLINEGLDS